MPSREPQPTLIVRSEATTPSPDPPAAPASSKPRRRAPASRRARALAFVAAAGVVLVYALRGGGSYDLVTFEEQGLIVWWVLALALALGLLPRARPARVTVMLLAALAAYAAWTALSLLWTNSAELTTVEIARTLDYLGIVTLAVTLLDRDTWRAAAAGVGAAAMVVCAIALGSRLAPGVVGHDHVDAFLHTDRLSYPFGYWNAVAAFGAMCVALGITWSAHDRSRIRRAIALGFVPVAGAVVYLTYSRAGAIGAGCAVIASLALSRNRTTGAIHAVAAGAGTALVVVAIRGSSQIAHGTGTAGAGGVIGVLALAVALAVVVAVLTSAARIDRVRLPRRLRTSLTIAGTVALLVPAGVVGPSVARRAWHSFTKTAAPANGSDPAARLTSLAGSRYTVWKSAVKEFEAHPVLGTGAGTFEFTWNRLGSTGEFVRDTHNIWLENLSELGLPGLLLSIAVALSAIAVAATARRRARRGASAGVAAAFLALTLVYLVHASVDWMWESTAVTVLALLGVSVVGARLSSGPSRLRVPVRAALVALAVLAALVQLPGILSSRDIGRSQAAAAAGDSAVALALARDAVSIEPWSASAHEQEALVLESEGALLQARRQESEAVSRERTNYVHYLIRARIETELGELNPALRDYNKARSLRPHAAVFVLAPYFAPGAR